MYPPPARHSKAARNWSSQVTGLKPQEEMMFVVFPKCRSLSQYIHKDNTVKTPNNFDGSTTASIASSIVDPSLTAQRLTTHATFEKSPSRETMCRALTEWNELASLDLVEKKKVSPNYFLKKYNGPTH